MGFVLKLIDTILFLFFLVIAVVAPLIDAQTCLPLSYFPDFLVELKTKYSQDYGDYLVVEKPHFFVGLVWHQLLFQWPLALINLYAILFSKPWFNTTCLIYGVSVSTSMVFIFLYYIYFAYSISPLLNLLSVTLFFLSNSIKFYIVIWILYWYE